MTYTKQAFSEARQKLLPYAFIFLNDNFIKEFYSDGEFKKYKRFVICGIDGCVHEIPNNKYKGSALLQKKFTEDFLTKKQKTNKGEVPQYYVEKSHPFIISPEVFDLAQHEFKKRKNEGYYKTSGGCFSSKIICGECGSFYGSKVWHSTSIYRRMIWQCNHKFKNNETCQTPHFYEDTLKQAFIDAFNSLIENKNEILHGYQDIIGTLTDTTALDEGSAKFHSESDIVLILMHKCVEENAQTALDQADYQKRYNALVERYETAKKRLAEIGDKKLERKAKRERIVEFIGTLKQSDTVITEFDEGLWNATVDNVSVHSECMSSVFDNVPKLSIY